jgi:hypothetical protein
MKRGGHATAPSVSDKQRPGINPGVSTTRLGWVASATLRHRVHSQRSVLLRTLPLTGEAPCAIALRGGALFYGLLEGPSIASPARRIESLYSVRGPGVLRSKVVTLLHNLPVNRDREGRLEIQLTIAVVLSHRALPLRSQARHHRARLP